MDASINYPIFYFRTIEIVCLLGFMTRKIKNVYFKKNAPFFITIISNLCIINGFSICDSRWRPNASLSQIGAYLTLSPISRNLERVS